jgi:hemolysin III
MDAATPALSMPVAADAVAGPWRGALYSRASVRAQTRREEAANAISHGIGCVMAATALPILVVSAMQRGRTADVVGAVVFGSTMILQYFVSTLYHAWPASASKAWMGRVDHAAIYLFIAGSYMPFALGLLRGPWGWSLFALVWTLAFAGVVTKLRDRLTHPMWSTALYVAMGWAALVATVPIVERMSPAGLAWLVSGGFFYTAGALVYLLDSRVRYAHLVWHVFVMAGSACHFCAALWHAIV